MKKIYACSILALAIGGTSNGSVSRVYASDSYEAELHLVVKSFIAPISEDKIGFENASLAERERAKLLAKITNASAVDNPLGTSEQPRDYRLWSSKKR